VAVILTSIIGSMASTNTSIDSWYLSLNKSELNPPGYVFGIVWPILYVFMMVSAVLTHKKTYSLFLSQLVLNASWSWLFFKFQLPVLALLDIYILIFLNIYISKLMYFESKVAFSLYLPYVIWITFASYLNLFIVIYN
tara:strand:- start:799 stop:1212 length:414 start_codon:yes stop_codon:yes gene_type:complete